MNKSVSLTQDSNASLPTLIEDLLFPTANQG